MQRKPGPERPVREKDRDHWALPISFLLKSLQDMSSACSTQRSAAVATWNAFVYGIGNCHLLGAPPNGRWNRHTDLARSGSSFGVWLVAASLFSQAQVAALTLGLHCALRDHHSWRLISKSLFPSCFPEQRHSWLLCS